jgi:alkyl sulfatase BDS1-like metallo-beta-lactamase superfamily hydrolase
MKYLILTTCVVLLLGFRPVCGEESDATKLLKARSEQLKPRVVQVSKSVYCATGYSPANIAMIGGNGGIVIVDAGMFPTHAEAALADFRKITKLPIAGIILTHGHGDHTGGVSVFVGAGQNDGKVPIYAREPFNTEAVAFNAAGITINRLRGARQGGFQLPPEKRINNGIAPAVYPPKNKNVFAGGPIMPTETFSSGRKKIELAGIELELVAAPGETSDQLYVWFPAERVVFTGDNFYRSWPNLYAIRGTGYRDVGQWIHSLDMMLAEKPRHAVPGHTLPLIGEKQTIEILTNYRDAIRYVFDATIEGMNKGMTPDELVHRVKLPPELATKDYLREFYGNVEWGVRAIFSGTIGWFDGNPTHLFSLPPAEEAKRMARLAGGEKQLASRARQALDEGDAQWCAQLCDHLIALNPEAREPKLLKAESLEVLAYKLMTATGRNYYLTVAQELRRAGSR